MPGYPTESCVRPSGLSRRIVKTWAESARIQSQGGGYSLLFCFCCVSERKIEGRKTAELITKHGCQGRTAWHLFLGEGINRAFFK